jgi:hypothetical protein
MMMKLKRIGRHLTPARVMVADRKRRYTKNGQAIHIANNFWLTNGMIEQFQGYEKHPTIVNSIC